MALTDFPNLAKVLEDFAIEVRNEYQDELIRGNKIASGELLNTAEYEVTANGTHIIVALELQDYWKYVEEGVRGDRNPASPYANPGWKAYPFIREWIQIKPVIPRPMANGKLPSLNTLSYLITRGIVQHGTQPTHALNKAAVTIWQRFDAAIEQALTDDLAQMTEYELVRYFK